MLPVYLYELSNTKTGEVSGYNKLTEEEAKKRNRELGNNFETRE